MYSVTNRFLNAIRTGVTPVAKADIYFPGQGKVYSDLPVSGGSVSMNRGQKTRASGSMIIPDPELAPILNEDSPLNPYGYEVVLKVGFKFGTEFELVPMGFLQIEDAEIGEDDVTTIQFSDRARAVERTDLVSQQDYSGWLVLDAIEDIITYASPFYPGPNTEWSVTIDTVNLDNPRLPGGTVFDTGRWSFLDSLCEIIGAEAYFNRDGNAVVAPIPAVKVSTPLSASVFTIDVGEMGVLLESTRHITRQDVYNGVVVAGAANEGTPQPFFLATDTDSTSRTYFNGPFGKSILRVENSSLVLVAQCQVAANNILKESTSFQRAITFRSLRNPALDPGDFLLVKHLDGSQNLMMLESYDFDLTTFDMSGELKSIQYIEG